MLTDDIDDFDLFNDSEFWRWLDDDTPEIVVPLETESSSQHLATPLEGQTSTLSFEKADSSSNRLTTTSKRSAIPLEGKHNSKRLKRKNEVQITFNHWEHVVNDYNAKNPNNPVTLLSTLKKNYKSLGFGTSSTKLKTNLLKLLTDKTPPEKLLSQLLQLKKTSPEYNEKRLEWIKYVNAIDKLFPEKRKILADLFVSKAAAIANMVYESAKFPLKRTDEGNLLKKLLWSWFKARISAEDAFVHLGLSNEKEREKVSLTSRFKDWLMYVRLVEVKEPNEFIIKYLKDNSLWTKALQKKLKSTSNVKSYQSKIYAQLRKDE